MALASQLGEAGLPVLLQQLLGFTQEDAKTATGTTRADAYPLVASLTQFTTVASGTGAVLPTLSTAGNPIYQQFYFVKNDGAETLTVYAAGTISGTAGATGVSVLAAEGAMFLQVAAGSNWIVFPMGT
jgi:hypothetical protein